MNEINDYIASTTIQANFVNLTGLDMNSIVDWIKELFRLTIGQFVLTAQGYGPWLVAILAIFMVITLSIWGFKFFKH